MCNDSMKSGTAGGIAGAVLAFFAGACAASGTATPCRSLTIARPQAGSQLSFAAPLFLNLQVGPSGCAVPTSRTVCIKER